MAMTDAAFGGLATAVLTSAWLKITLTVGLISFIATLRTIIVNRFSSPISHFPGPFWGSVTRLYLIYYHLKGVELQKMKEWHAKYGMVYCYFPVWREHQVI